MKSDCAAEIAPAHFSPHLLKKFNSGASEYAIEVIKGRILEETKPIGQKTLGNRKAFLEGIYEKLSEDKALTDEEREKASKIIEDNRPVAPGILLS